MPVPTLGSLVATLKGANGSYAGTPTNHDHTFDIGSNNSFLLVAVCPLRENASYNSHVSSVDWDSGGTPQALDNAVEASGNGTVNSRYPGASFWWRANPTDGNKTLSIEFDGSMESYLAFVWTPTDVDTNSPFGSTSADNTPAPNGSGNYVFTLNDAGSGPALHLGLLANRGGDVTPYDPSGDQTAGTVEVADDASGTDAFSDISAVVQARSSPGGANTTFGIKPNTTGRDALVALVLNGTSSGGGFVGGPAALGHMGLISHRPWNRRRRSQLFVPSKDESRL